jgi:hypothetical protein
MTKQEKIQEAYGEHWEKVKYFVDKDGWFDAKSFYGQAIHKGLVGLTMEISDPYDPKYCYWKRPVSLSGINNNNGWIKVDDMLPEEGIEVLCFNEAWINEDFNPKGIRIGFLNGSEWTTAHYWNYQDTYMTISHSYCDNDEEFSDEIRDNIDPTHYMLFSDKQPIY